jgi:hypothetical protein
MGCMDALAPAGEGDLGQRFCTAETNCEMNGIRKFIPLCSTCFVSNMKIVAVRRECDWTTPDVA